MSTLRDALAALFPDVAARQCRKVGHKSQGKAEAHLRAMRRRAETCVDPDALATYRCGRCGLWHTGHELKEEVQR